jgi:hypothetical protein
MYYSTSGPLNTSGSTTNVALPTLWGRGNDLFKASSVCVSITNPSGSGQNITSGSLLLQDTVGGLTSTVTYSLGTVSVVPGANATFQVSLTNGLLLSPMLSLGFAGTPSAGTLAVECAWQKTNVVLPAAPAITATGGTGSVVVGMASSVPGASTYNLQYSPDNGTTAWANVSGGTGLAFGSFPFTDSNSATNMSATTGLIYYRAQAVNAAGQAGLWSASANASPYILYDNWQETSGTNLAGKSPVFGPGGATWNALVGVWSAQGGNQAKCTSSPTNATFVANCGQANFTLACNLTIAATGTPNTGLSFRTTDVNNWWEVNWYKGSNTIFLFTQIAGSFTERASASLTLTPGNTYQFKVVCSGGTIAVYVNGTQYLSVSNSTFSSITNVGFYEDGQQSIFGPITVTSP